MGMLVVYIMLHVDRRTNSVSPGCSSRMCKDIRHSYTEVNVSSMIIQSKCSSHPLTLQVTEDGFLPACDLQVT